MLSRKDAGKVRIAKLTRLCNADSDIPPLKLSASEFEGLFQAFQCCEFSVAKALWLFIQPVFDDPYACD